MPKKDSLYEEILIIYEKSCLCTGTAEVMGQNPVQAWIFPMHEFHNCFKLCL